jgi:hypothetical protein
MIWPVLAPFSLGMGLLKALRQCTVSVHGIVGRVMRNVSLRRA